MAAVFQRLMQSRGWAGHGPLLPEPCSPTCHIQKLILSMLASLSVFMEKFFQVPAVVSEVTTVSTLL